MVIVRIEVIAGDLYQLLRGRVSNGVEVAAIALVVVAEDVEATEATCDAGDVLALEVFVGQKIRARALEFVEGNPLGAKSFHLPYDSLDGEVGSLGVGFEVHREEPGVERRVAGGVDPIDELVAILHKGHQAARLALPQDERQQVEQRRVRIGEPGTAPGHVYPDAFEGALDDGAAQRGL